MELRYAMGYDAKLCSAVLAAFIGALGNPTRKLVHPVRELDSPDEALADFGGVNIHVGPMIDGRDRRRLERLCRYMGRPPVCQERLSVTESGQVVVRFKNAWRNGAHAVVLDPLDFIARLVALIPSPHFNTVRYHGVLAARAVVRSDVVPGAAPEQREPIQMRLAFDGEATELELELKAASRHPWAWLLARVFAVDRSLELRGSSRVLGPAERRCCVSCADSIGRLDVLGALQYLSTNHVPTPSPRPNAPVPTKQEGTEFAPSDRFPCDHTRVGVIRSGGSTPSASTTKTPVASGLRAFFGPGLAAVVTNPAPPW